MAPESRHVVGLPLAVVGPVDLGRLIRELGNVDNALREQQIRAPGQEVKAPKTTIMLDELLQLNKMDLLKEADRKAMKEFLATVKLSAPHIHISFSADPSPLFVQKLTNWLRTEIHPVVLLTVGLQPGIGAGCVVRTTNKYFDMSLAQDFTKKRDMLLAALRAPAPTAAPATPVAVVAEAPAGVAA